MSASRRDLLIAAGGGAALAAAIGPGAAAETPRPTKEAYMARWAAAETVELWPGAPPGVVAFRARPLPPGADPAHVCNIARPALRVFRSPRPNGQGLLVAPGGSYAFVSVDNEGMDVAERFNAMGVTVFVLTYRLPGEGWARRQDVPLQDAQRAVRLIRARAAEFGVAPERLAVLGFSAGGHLAASLATGFASPLYDRVDAADSLSARPFAAGLIYPVVMMAPPYAHAESRERLLGPHPTAAAVAAHTPPAHVGPQTPPVFLAHASDDDAVPVENSLLMLDALRRANRPVEAHIFQEGRHAFGVGRPGTPTAFWPELFAAWLARLSAPPAA